jgi:hypothetical protein
MLPWSSVRQNALEYEIKKEQAVALGHAGREVERALLAYRNACRQHEQNEALVTKLRYAAANAVWRYFIQREASGIYNHDVAIEEYGIPKNVLNIVGARRP